MKPRHDLSHPYQLACIAWSDHCASHANGWRDIQAIRDQAPFVILSVGWIVNETADHLVMVGTLEPVGGMCSGDITIVKSCIKGRWPIVPPVGMEKFIVSGPRR